MTENIRHNACPMTFYVGVDSFSRDCLAQQLGSVTNVNHRPAPQTTQITPWGYFQEKFIKAGLRYAGTIGSFLPYISILPPLYENYGLLKKHFAPPVMSGHSGAEEYQPLNADIGKNNAKGVSMLKTSHSYQDFIYLQKNKRQHEHQRQMWMRFLANVFSAKSNFCASNHKTTYLISVSASSASQALHLSVGCLSIFANIFNISSSLIQMNSGWLDAQHFHRQEKLLATAECDIDTSTKRCVQEWLNRKKALNHRKNLLLGLEILGNCMAIMGTICGLSGVGLPISLVLSGIGSVIALISLAMIRVTELQELRMNSEGCSANPYDLPEYPLGDASSREEIAHASAKIKHYQSAIAMAKTCGLLHKALASDLRAASFDPACAAEAVAVRPWQCRASEVFATLERQTSLLPSDIQLIRRHADPILSKLSSDAAQAMNQLLQRVQLSGGKIGMELDNALPESVLSAITGRLLKYRNDPVIKQALGASQRKDYLTVGELSALCGKNLRADLIRQHYILKNIISQVKSEGKYRRQQACRDIIDILTANRQAQEA